MKCSDETNVMQSIPSSFGDCSSSAPKQTNYQMNVYSQMALNSSVEGNKRPGIPPCHPQFPPASPHSQITMPKMASQQVASQSFTTGPTHTRSLSQSSFFSFDNLPPLSPSSFVRESPSTSFADVSMEDRAYSSAQQALPVHAPAIPARPMINTSEFLPPRRGHSRSSSDIPHGFASTIQPSSQPVNPGSPVFLDKFGGQKGHLDGQKPIQLTNRDGSLTAGVEDVTVQKTNGEAIGDLFSAYMNLDSFDSLNSSSVEDKDMDSRASGTRTNDSSENEVESGIDGNCNCLHGASSGMGGEKRDRGKRSVPGDIAPTSRHFRSLSMDSFMGNLNFNDESPKLPPSPGICSGQHSPSDSFGGTSNKFSLEFGNGEFSAVELKKIMANEKLAEIAVADPKRAKRILANRQSAARSKERKLRYIAELEHKVQILQTEATTLSAQLTLLQRDSAGLTTQNNELRFRLQAMEQQAQLRDALNEALTAEVQRLKLATSEISGESPQQLRLKDSYQRLQMQNQSSQYNMCQLQHPQRNQNQNQNLPIQQTQPIPRVPAVSAGGRGSKELV